MINKNLFLKRHPSAFGIPKGSEGQNGDIMLRLVSSGELAFFAKYNNSWYRLNSSFYRPNSQGGITIISDSGGHSETDDPPPTSTNGVIFHLNNIIKVGNASGISNSSVSKLRLGNNTNVNGSLKVDTIAASGSDTDKFLVSDSGLLKYRTGTQVLSDIGAMASTATGDSGNAAIYDNSGTPTLKSGITAAEVRSAIGAGTGDGDITGVTLTADDTNTASDTSGSADFTIAGGEGVDTTVSGTTVTIAGELATTSNAGIARFHTDDFTVSTGSVTKKAKQAFASEFAGRYTVATNGRFSGGYPNYHLKTATIATISGTGDTAVNVDTLKYSLMMPEAGNVTAFSADLEWDTADGEIYVDLWKFGVMSNTGSGLTSVACDHISRLTFTDPSDTTYYKEKADGSLDGTAADFAAGESLCVTMQGDSNSDGSYVYSRPVITVVYDS